MTKFSTLLEALLQDRVRKVHRIALGGLVAIVVTAAWMMIFESLSLSNGDLLGIIGGWSFVVYAALFISLSQTSERAYMSDMIRLIPVSDMKLYTANLLATIIAFIYGVLIQVALHLVGLLISFQGWASLFKDIPTHVSDLNGMPMPIVIFLVLLLIFAIVVATWTTISFIHLVSVSIALYLPAARQHGIQILLYIVATIGILHVLSLIARASDSNSNMFQTSNTVLGSFTFNLVGILLIILIESALNIVMMKKWVETTV